MKKPWIVGTVALLAIIIAVLVFVFQPKPLTLTGLVQSQEMRDASRFGGRVEKVFVKEGDTVKVGDPIVLFDKTELLAKINQAKAALTQAKAQESLLAAGADASDLRQSIAFVREAEQGVKMSRKSADANLSQAEAQLQTAQAGYAQAKAAYDNGPTMLKEGIISQQKFDNIKAQFSEAQSVLKAASQAVDQAQHASRSEQVKIAQSKLDAAKATYNKLAAGAKRQELDIAMATTEQAQSELDALEAQLAELTVNAKIGGVVSIFSLVPGDLVLPNQPIVSIIDYDNLWTDVYVPESDLGRIRVNQVAVVTTPAHGKKVTFSGKVAAINPKSEFVPNSESTDAGEENAFRVKVRLNRYTDANTKKAELYPGMKVTVEFGNAG